MFIKTPIALAVIVGITSGALAATTKQHSPNPAWEVYDCRGVYVVLDPKLLINRPQNGMCESVKE
jgi:hypothetical protein